MFGIILSVLCSFFLIFSAEVSAKSLGSTLCTQPGYTCYIVKRGDTWAKLYPDPTQRNTAMRVNRMNIELYPGARIAMPNNASAGVGAYSPFPTKINSRGEKVIYVSLSNLAFGAYDPRGDLLYWGPISAARGYCPDIGRGCNTPRGRFVIESKQGPGCRSTKYPVGRGGAPMPYCMFFHGNFAMHGSYSVPGFNDSHGCVRLFIDDARWLNQVFTPGGRTNVVIY